ncbi:MAG: hypothetical protein FWE68_00660 [Defluviitaleaceae bacterium]|nr:hypothetical protein [Defluviitaleaceae bacterium]
MWYGNRFGWGGGWRGWGGGWGFPFYQRSFGPWWGGGYGYRQPFFWW